MATRWRSSEGDASDREAGRALSDALYRLRRALDEGAVVGTADGRLELDRCRVDLAGFEAALASGDLDAAVGLWRGPFLDSFGDALARLADRRAQAGESQAALAAAERGGQVLDLACGVRNGPAKIVRAFPGTRFTAVDGDAFTIDRARENLDRQGLADRFELVQSPLESLALREAADVAVINISLHEARDIERVVANARRALRGGGIFLVSEFPFPETLEACRTLPAQIMCGIQFFEAHIGCQLLPAWRFVELLEKAGFRDVETVEVTPVHVVVHGTR